MKRLLPIYFLLCSLVTSFSASYKISDLPIITSPSTNTFIEVADMNAATKSRKYLLTNLVSNWTASGTTNSTLTGTATAGGFDIPLLSLGNASSTVVVDFSTLGFRTMNATNDLSISVTNMPANVARTIEYVIYTGTTNRAVTWESALTNSMGAPLPTILPSNNVVNLTLRSVGTAVTNVMTYVSWRIP